MSKLPIYTMAGEQVGEYELADDLLVFDKGLPAVHEVIRAYLANQRQGSAATKTRAFVAGTGKKPWKQKGSGRARAGAKQSPVWRGGGVAFGPQPRSFRKDVNKKTARLAFRRALSDKVAAGDVVVLERLELPAPKTRELAQIAKSLQAETKGLFLVDQVAPELGRAARNLATVAVARVGQTPTYQLLNARRIVVTQAGMAELEKRLRSAAGRQA
ncbi:MAG: 50S ribosomal protein L4 [Candidatus Marinimicrobia bacterium]|nr:50S ribosomal protein L4 [Candidatus Neomarinimicrobiota bacterium]